MEINCPNCGAGLAEGDKFCKSCGAKFEGKAVKPVEPTPTENIPQKQKKGNISMITAALAIVISIIAVVSSVFLNPLAAIEAGSVGENELADNSVTSSKIADGTITDEDINNAGISKIIDGSITMNDFSSAVTDVITGVAEIANNSITSEKIANGTITTDDLADDSVTSDKIVNDTIKSSDIGTDAVGSSEIASGAVGSDEIATGAVDTDELAADAVTYDKMEIKIKCGLATSVIHGDTINHGLGHTPTSVVVTPVYDYIYEGGYIVIHANVNNVTANSFDIALWAEMEYLGIMTSWCLQKVDGSLDYPAQDVYWIAIYSP